MSTTRIQDALLEVRDAVEVPAPDEVAFRSHLRAARRARLTRRVAVGVAAVAAVGVVPLVGLRGPTGSPPPATRPPAPAAPTAAQLFPVSLHGKLQIVMPDGSSYTSPVRVEEVLGSGPAGVVAVAHDSHLLLVPLSRSGQPQEPVDLGDGHPVERAWLDKTGNFVAFLDVLHQLHVRAVGSDADLRSPARLPDEQTPLAVDESHWVLEDSGIVTANTAAVSIALDTGGSALSAQIGGSTLAYQTADELEFFDLTTGKRLATSPGAPIGALSPDGGRYVAAPGDQQRDTGASAAWYLVDPRTGQRAVFDGRPARAVAIAVTWQDDDRFLVLATDRRQPGNRIVWDCSVAGQRCTERYNDPEDSLQIPTR